MIDTPVLFTTQRDFLAAINYVPEGRWEPRPGVTLLFQQRGQEKVLQLTLASSVRHPGMLHQLLQRRFLEAETCADCYLSMNEQRDLLVCCQLPVEEENRVNALDRLWRLTGLPPL
ncbi:hypothetical protein BIY29_07225 [Brenneria alni]|uniref:Type III secretion protein n=1 Tax=Brenneria alni TaxID=71656 RepID=A0A421DQ77_9GAMM|nr:type III secretion protein [Brenneria alni]RLM25297.1 hypothetical protein BIY29_07225 [Brenneria alni]